MAKLADEKDFLRVQKQFETAMTNVQTQTEQIEVFMEASKDSFSTMSGISSTDVKEIESTIENQSANDEFSDKSIDEELARIRKEIDSSIQ